MYLLQRPFRPPRLVHGTFAILVALHCHNLLTLLRFAAPAAPAMPATVTCTLRPHMSYCSHQRVSRSMPVSMLHMVTCLSGTRATSSVNSHLSVAPTATCQYHPCGDTILCAQLLPAREVQVPPFREPTILLVRIFVQEQVLSLNYEPLFFQWSNLVNPNLTGSVTLTLLTAISCSINTVSLFFSGIQDRPAGTPPTLSRLPVESSMRFLFKKPLIMFRTSPISSLRTLTTRTSPSCSTRTPLSLTLRCLPSRKTPQAKVRGVWSYSSLEAYCDALHFLECHILLNTHSQCRGQKT